MPKKTTEDPKPTPPSKPDSSGQPVRVDRGDDGSAGQNEKKHHHGATEGELKPTSFDTTPMTLPFSLRT